jgi:lipopolysaccharide export LptBFGC system permease protein LptF
MLAGAALVMGAVTVILLVFIGNRSFPQGEKEAEGFEAFRAGMRRP